MMGLIIIYYSQGVLYPVGTIVSQLALLLLFLLSTVYFVFFSFLNGKASLYVKTWTALLIINVIYFFLEGNIYYLSIFQSILLNMLPFYAFYFFAQQGILKRKHLVVVFVILLPLIITRFITSKLEMQSLLYKDDIVDNTVYLFLGLLPFIFLFKNRILSIISLLIIWVFIVQSGKRAAFIAGAITLVIFFYYQFKTVNKNNKSVLWNLFISLFLLLVISIWGYQKFLENEFLVYRMELMLEGDTSGRDQLFSKVFSAWYDSDNMFLYLFGNGFQTSEKVTSIGSHNDWLNILASFGLFGFLIYLILFVSAFKEFFNKNWIHIKKACFVCLILIGALASLTSRWYGSSFAYSQMLLLPYLLATYNRED